MTNKNLSCDKPEYFQNRELSWLDFNYRVLEEALDPHNPLLERLKFLAITQSNLDEFIMVRVASIIKLFEVNFDEPDNAGLSVSQQLKAINQKITAMVNEQYQVLNQKLIPAINQIGVRLKTVAQLSDEQYAFIKNYFDHELYPVLTPMADDSSRPFPFISNDSLNLAFRIKETHDQVNTLYAVLQVPDVFDRVVKLPGATNDFILLEDIIKAFVNNLFVKYEVLEVAPFRVIRDMDLDVAEEDTSDLLKKVQQQLRLREHGHVINLEVAKTISDELKQRLITELNAGESSLLEIDGPLNLTFLSELVKKITGFENLKFPDFQAFEPTELSDGNNIFAAIKKHDWLLQHPYEKFDPVVEFIRQASIDENVLAIKMTLYRVSGDSPIIKYLGRAAQNKKQVTVLVEVKARFDEENNVHWAKQLERMGCHVIYGLVGLKTHAKLSMVVRKDQSEINRYIHLGTGNYNDVTAHFYTDLGLFTCNNDIAKDVTNVFNMLSGYSIPPELNELHISPNGIKQFIKQKLEQAEKLARAGHSVTVKMKMNSLTNKSMIMALYKASMAGVKIQLLIRGICCLKTGIKKISDNIEVHSIVGRFLEHSRIYLFDFGEEQPEVYISSADLMTRNLNRRVEQLAPVIQPDLNQQVMQIFDTLWADNVKTRILLPDNTYSRVAVTGETLNAQEVFIAQATAKIAQQKIANQKRMPNHFQPLTSLQLQEDETNLTDDQGE